MWCGVVQSVKWLVFDTKHGQVFSLCCDVQIYRGIKSASFAVAAEGAVHRGKVGRSWRWLLVFMHDCMECYWLFNFSPYLTPDQRVEALFLIIFMLLHTTSLKHLWLYYKTFYIHLPFFSINWMCSICIIVVAVMFAYCYPDIFWCRVRMSSSSSLLSHRGPALLGEETSDCDINDYWVYICVQVCDKCLDW